MVAPFPSPTSALEGGYHDVLAWQHSLSLLLAEPQFLPSSIPLQDFCSSDTHSVCSSPKLVLETDHLSQLRDILALLKLLYSFATQGVRSVNSGCERREEGGG